MSERPVKGTPEYELWLAAIEVAIYPALAHGSTTGTAKIPWDRIETLRTALDALDIDWRTTREKEQAARRARLSTD